MRQFAGPGKALMETTDAAARVERIIAPTLDDMGYEVVRVQLSGGRQHSRLQVMAERADQQGMTVADCAEISRAVSALLDVEDPIAGSYDLEVSRSEERRVGTECVSPCSSRWLEYD